MREVKFFALIAEAVLWHCILYYVTVGGMLLTLSIAKS